MKASLTFKLPEENDDFKLACNALGYSLTLWDLDQHLRTKIKYQELSEAEYKIYEEIRSKLHELANDHEVQVG